MAALTLEGAVITVSLPTPRDGRCENLGGSARSRLCSVCEGGAGSLQQQPSRNWEGTKAGQLKNSKFKIKNTKNSKLKKFLKIKNSKIKNQQ